MNNKKVKFIDIFAGIGGLRLGFEQAFSEQGIKTECILTSEIKPYAIESLKRNFPHKDLQGDVTQINTEDIEDFDFLLAGFPCQAFSTAGNRLGFLDTRGTLFWEVERILKHKRPQGFILENVEGLVIHDLDKKSDEIGKTLKTILISLRNLGYFVKWKILDSKDFGVAQSRRRVFIVGTLDSEVDLNCFSLEKKVFGDIKEENLETVDSHFTRCLLKNYRVEELHGKAIKDKRGGKNNIHSWDIGLRGIISQEQKDLLNMLFKERRRKKWAQEIGIDWMDGMPLTLSQIETFYDSDGLKEMLDDLVDKGYLKKEHPKGVVEVSIDGGATKRIRKEDKSKPIGYNIVAGKLSFEFTKILSDYDVTNTLVAMDVSKIGVIDGKGIRNLTIREGLRLFGYPESYSLDFLGTNKKGVSQAFDLLGNTVAVPVVKAVTKKLIDAIRKREAIVS